MSKCLCRDYLGRSHRYVSSTLWATLAHGRGPLRFQSSSMFLALSSSTMQLFVRACFHSLVQDTSRREIFIGQEVPTAPWSYAGGTFTCGGFRLDQHCAGHARVL